MHAFVLQGTRWWFALNLADCKPISHKNQWCLTKLDEHFWLNHKYRSVIWDVIKVLMQGACFVLFCVGCWGGCVFCLCVLFCFFPVLYVCRSVCSFITILYTHTRTYNILSTVRPRHLLALIQIMWLHIYHIIFSPCFSLSWEKVVNNTSCLSKFRVIIYLCSCQQSQWNVPCIEVGGARYCGGWVFIPLGQFIL